MRRVFKATRRSWITEAIAPILLLIAPGFALVLFSPGFWIYFVALCGIIGVLFYLSDFLPLWRNHIEMDHESIRGSIGKRDFNINWKEVKVASRETVKGISTLHLVTDETDHNIALPFLDSESIWSGIQFYVKSEALRADAYKTLPGYKEWAESNAKLISELREPLRVGMRGIKIIGWVGTIFFVLMALLAWFTGGKGTAPFFLIFALPGTYLILCSGTVEMDTEYIILRTPLGRYGMRWDEIQDVETDPLRYGLVFTGLNKSLSIPAPGNWSGNNCNLMFRLFNAMLDQKGLTIKETRKALWKYSKNSKIN